MSIKEILAAIFGFISLIVVILWLSQFDDYQACLENPKINKNDCLIEFLMMSPPIQEANDLAETCNKTDTECLTKIGIGIIEEKVTK